MKPHQLKQLIREEIKNITKSLTEGKYDADLDKIEAAVKNASSFMNVGAELKKAGIKYDFSTSMIPMYTVKVSGNTIAIVNKKYVDDAEREVNNIAIGLLEGVNESVIKEFFSKPLEEASQTKIPYLPLSKKEVETLNSKGKVTKTFAGTGFSHRVDRKIVNTYLNTKEVTYTDWNTGQRVKAPVDVEYSNIVGYISITVYGKKNMNEAEREVNNIAIGLLEGVNESVIKEFNENFIGAALVKKSGMVKDLDSLEKEPIYVKDVLPIYRKEGSSYVVKSSLTGNALKVPAANLIVKMKDQFEPDKWVKFMSKVSRY